MAECTFEDPLAWGWIALGVILLLWLVRSCKNALTLPARCTESQPTKGNPADKLTLVQLGPGGPPMVGSVSPFCAKLETMLRMGGLEFTLKADLPFNSPKGKMPFLQHGSNVIADSTLCLRYLENTYGRGIGGKMVSVEDLSADQRALAIAVQRMVENNLYFTLLHTRWLESYGFSFVQRASFGDMPAPLRAIVPRVIRKGMWNAITAHGATRISPEERARFAEEDLSALSTILGTKQFILSDDRPSTLDPTVFAFLEQIVNGPKGHGEWMSAIVAKYPNLGAYVDRVQKAYFAGPAGGAGAGGAESKK